RKGVAAIARDRRRPAGLFHARRQAFDDSGGLGGFFGLRGSAVGKAAEEIRMTSAKMTKRFRIAENRNASRKQIPRSVIAARGFRASGVFCDIKRLGTGKGSQKGMKRDLALIVSEVPATVAGTFTTNQVCAAPVKVCLERVRKGTAQAIVVNSGNANA